MNAAVWSLVEVSNAAFRSTAQADATEKDF